MKWRWIDERPDKSKEWQPTINAIKNNIWNKILCATILAASTLVSFPCSYVCGDVHFEAGKKNKKFYSDCVVFYCVCNVYVYDRHIIKRYRN